MKSPLVCDGEPSGLVADSATPAPCTSGGFDADQHGRRHPVRHRTDRTGQSRECVGLQVDATGPNPDRRGSDPLCRNCSRADCRIADSRFADSRFADSRFAAVGGAARVPVVTSTVQTHFGLAPDRLPHHTVGSPTLLVIIRPA